jgi:hypothetical protein
LKKLILPVSEDQSPLFGAPPDADEDSSVQTAALQSEDPPSRPAYGGLAPNPRAKTRRGQVQFFDSADWAMKQGSGEQTAQSPTPEVLSAFTQPPSGSAPVAADSESSILFAPDGADE